MYVRPIFDRVVVMDPVPLTGHALCALADMSGVAREPGVYLPDRQVLYEALDRYDGAHILVITELSGQQESLAGGLAMLTRLKEWPTAGRVRVMVCTRTDDPLLLKLVADRGPSSLCLRRESLDVLCRSMAGAAQAQTGVRLSPAAEAHLQASRLLRASPRELEWLVTQVDGLSLQESARAMAVCDKTAYSWRSAFVRRMGGKRAFIRYLAGLQRVRVPVATQPASA